VSSERRAEDAYDRALRALHHRDRTEREIDEHLRDRGFSEDERAEALVALRRTGLVNDQRFAGARAARLAERGEGNALIRARLAAAGIPNEAVQEALAALDDEGTRARRIVERRGRSQKTARYLGGKGFADDVVRSVIAEDRDGELG